MYKHQLIKQIHLQTQLPGTNDHDKVADFLAITLALQYLTPQN